MKEAGTSNICNWRPNLLSSMNDVNTKSVNRVPPNVIPVDARYQHLTLVIVHKQSTNHFRLEYNLHTLSLSHQADRIGGTDSIKFNSKLLKEKLKTKKIFREEKYFEDVEIEMLVCVLVIVIRGVNFLFFYRQFGCKQGAHFANIMPIYIQLI